MTHRVPDAEPLTVWTVGHSTRSLDELLAALRAHGVRTVADVRAFPASRRHPHFAREPLERALGDAGLAYAWLGETLGGRRTGAPGSRHAALRVAGFRAYADHMETKRFRAGVDALEALARSSPTAAMCAELLWWRCHRAFLADHLVLLRGMRVVHVRDAGHATVHVPRPEARVEGDHLVYDLRPDGGPTLFEDATR
jgi:uncharacterized protein (DUF488 family)